MGNAASARFTASSDAAATSAAAGPVGFGDPLAPGIDLDAAATPASRCASASASRHIALDARSDWTSSIEEDAAASTSMASFAASSPMAPVVAESFGMDFPRLLASMVPACT